ncbi:MAG: mechanosensitive ion channel family protein [Terriglobales bacterium]|jgi:small-conductance mechanosensitive channel
MSFLRYPVATIGTAAAIVAAFLVYFIGVQIINRRELHPPDQYRLRKTLMTLDVIFVVLAIALLWARLLQHTGTFLGLIGAGVAVALRDPLLSIAGRIAIFAGHMYTVGDRIEISKMSGDVIDVGFFYTRLLEIGNWIGGDQATGRVVQFSNNVVFGNPVFNYTQNFSYIWDEVKLPIKYSSNVQAATEIMMRAASEYTKKFLHKAEADLEQMQKSFLVPKVELKPAVFLKVTDNWVELAMRYIVDPKKRRAAGSFIYTKIFDAIEGRQDIQIASSTMEVTVNSPDLQTSQRPKAA